MELSKYPLKVSQNPLDVYTQAWRKRKTTLYLQSAREKIRLRIDANLNLLHPGGAYCPYLGNRISCSSERRKFVILNHFHCGPNKTLIKPFPREH